jgi:hypothetical protein
MPESCLMAIRELICITPHEILCILYLLIFIFNQHKMHTFPLYENYFHKKLIINTLVRGTVFKHLVFDQLR